MKIYYYSLYKQILKNYIKSIINLSLSALESYKSKSYLSSKYIYMSTGPFSRTNTKATKINLQEAQQKMHKSEFVKSQVINQKAEQKTTQYNPKIGGYVYRPPNKILAVKKETQQNLGNKSQVQNQRSNASSISQRSTVSRSQLNKPKIELAQNNQNKSSLQSKQINEPLNQLVIKQTQTKSRPQYLNRTPISRATLNNNQALQNTNQTKNIPEIVNKVQNKGDSPIKKPFQRSKQSIRMQKIQSKQQQIKTTLNQSNSILKVEIIAMKQKSIIEKQLIEQKSVKQQNQNPQEKIIVNKISPLLKNKDNPIIVQTQKDKQFNKVFLHNISINKSIVSLLVGKIHQLYQHKMKENFIQIKQQQMPIKIIQKQRSVFLKNLINLINRLTLNIHVTSVFMILKQSYLKQVQKPLSSVVYCKKSRAAKIIVNIINKQNIYNQYFIDKLKSILSTKQILQRKQISYTKPNHLIGILCLIAKRNMKQVLTSIKSIQYLRYQSKKILINQWAQIFDNYGKNLIAHGINKINQFNLKNIIIFYNGPLNQNNSTITQKNLAINQKYYIQNQKYLIQDQKSQKIQSRQTKGLQNQNTQLKVGINKIEIQLQKSLSNNKLANQKQQLLHKIQQLKKQTDRMISQKNQKKQYKKDLQLNLVSLQQNKNTVIYSKEFNLNGNNLCKKSTQIQFQQSKQKSLLTLLHLIYLKIFKTRQTELNIKQQIRNILQSYNSGQYSQCRQVQKWIQMYRNLQLKRKINLFQQNQQQHNKNEFYLQVQKQKNIISTALRSYIKQRYLWEQIKNYVAASID